MTSRAILARPWTSARRTSGRWRGCARRWTRSRLPIEGRRAPASLDAETRERLAALGYVGGGADVKEGGNLPDPREKVEVFALFISAKAAAKAGRLQDAIAQMRTVVRQDPNIIDAHIGLGDWLLSRRQPAAAVAAYKRALSPEGGRRGRLQQAGERVSRRRRRTRGVRGARRLSRRARRQPPQSPGLVPARRSRHSSSGRRRPPRTRSSVPSR